MKQYQALVDRVITGGSWTENRTGVRTISKIGEMIQFDCYTHDFPLLTLRRISWKAVVVETLWHLRGEINTRFLKEHGVGIWDPWARDDGYVGPIYGYQWRRWGESQDIKIDQLQLFIDMIKSGSVSRQMVISAWNPYDLDSMVLPPCHFAFQLHVRPNNILDLTFYMRSVDVMIGLPFDIAGYALLLNLICQQTNKMPGKVTGLFGDAHIYEPHLNAAIEMRYLVTRPSPKFYPPKFIPESIDGYLVDIIIPYLHGYDPIQDLRLQVVK